MEMDTGENLLKKYEELTEWREKTKAIKKLKDKPSILLKELQNLASSVSSALRDINITVRQICNDTNDIKYQLESDNSLCIGKESVQPLIEFKNITTELFANVRESSTNDNAFTKDIDFGPYYQELEEMRRFANRSKEFIKQLNSVTEGIVHLENESEKAGRSESTLSIIGSDPSTSGFSLFANSETDVATSSPIS